MLKMTMVTRINALFTFYGLPQPEPDTIDAFFSMLKNLTEEALDHGIAEFRENHPKIRMGENVALSLKKYAATWRNPADNKPAGQCPDNCTKGVFFVRGASQSDYHVVPCAHCSPQFSYARTRAQLAGNQIHVLTLEEVVKNGNST